MAVYKELVNNNKDVELANCSFVKTVLMMIVVYHCILFWTENWFVEKPLIPSETLSLLSNWMNSFHIYGFTLVSGYLFFYLKFEKNSYQKFLPFLLNKAKRLLIPYVFVSFAWVIPVSEVFFDYSIGDIVKNYILGVAPSQLWFLLMLFCVFMIFYPLSKFFKEKTFLGGMVVLSLYGISFFFRQILPDFFQIFRAFEYLAFFWLGFQIRAKGNGNIPKGASIILILLDIVLFFLLQYLSRFTGIFFSLLEFGLTFLLHVLGAIMSFVVLQKVAQRIPWSNNRIFNYVSKSAMPVYLFHQQVVYFFIHFLNGAMNPYVHATINFLGVMTVSLLLSTVLMQYRWTRLLIGEK